MSFCELSGCGRLLEQPQENVYPLEEPSGTVRRMRAPLDGPPSCFPWKVLRTLAGRSDRVSASGSVLLAFASSPGGSSPFLSRDPAIPASIPVPAGRTRVYNTFLSNMYDLHRRVVESGNSAMFGWSQLSVGKLVLLN